MLLTGRQRVRLAVRATPEEHRLCTSDPDEVARIDAEEIAAAAEGAASAFLGCLAGLSGDAAAVATGAALALLEAVPATDVPLACRHRLVEARGEWMAGSATAGVEVTWTDGGRVWGECMRLGLVRRGASWLVADVVRVPGGGAP